MSNLSECQLSSATALFTSLAIKAEQGFVMAVARLGMRKASLNPFYRKKGPTHRAAAHREPRRYKEQH